MDGPTADRGLLPDSTTTWCATWLTGEGVAAGGLPAATLEAPPGSRTPRDTVMVIEPEAEELQRLCQALAAAGYRAIPVEDGHTALDWAEVFRPQAIVLSSALADFDARDLLLWLRQTEAGQTARIIIVVAPGETFSLEDRALATAVLERPVALPQLLAALSHDGRVATPAT